MQQLDTPEMSTSEANTPNNKHGAARVNMKNTIQCLVFSLWSLGAALSFGVAQGGNGGSGGPVPIGLEFQVNQTTTDFQGNPKVTARDDGSFVVVWESHAADEGDIFFRIFDSVGLPMTDEVQVNTYTTGEQAARRHSVAAFPDGSFIVAWDSTDSEGDSSSTSVHGRGFDSLGTPSGPQFQLNTLTTSYQWIPSVAVAQDGGFVMVWSSDFSMGSDSSSSSIQLRRWDSSGEPIADEIQLNTYTGGDQVEPAIARADSGDFLVVWSSDESPVDDPGLSIQGQLLSSDGSPEGEQFQINAYTEDDQDTVSVAGLPGGDFVVTWRSYGSPGNDQDESSTQARRVGSNGMVVGEQFQVNTYTTSYNDDPKLAVDASGLFFVVWESESAEDGIPTSPDGSGNAARGQLFSSEGQAIGGEIAINSITMGSQDDPAVAVIGPERAVVLFESETSGGDDTSGDSLHARLFDLCPGPNDGVDADVDMIPDDCDFCQGDNATGDIDEDGVCGDLDICLGDDASGDGDKDGICADRDCNDADPENGCAPIFNDGFESGNTFAWSATVGLSG